jgi:uncharacterized protein (TIGR03067 family)
MHGELPVKNTLPNRPHLDHLRRQAKDLLASLSAGDARAVATFKEHLPAAGGMTAKQVQGAGFRLADAQSAVARQTGFASWPALARHVETLRALEGTWLFESLKVGGQTIPAAGIAHSRLLIDGDRFRTESPEATYEGTFNIDVEAEPCTIDIDFAAGPEAGNRNMGVFRLEGDRLDLCLDMTGAGRPPAFTSTPANGYALETLRRAGKNRPDKVDGGVATLRGAQPPKPAASHSGDSCAPGFEYTPSPLADRLQGEWTAVQIVRDGMELPAPMLAAAKRSAVKNEIKITVGGGVVVHALTRINEAATPHHVDYFNLAGAAKGTIQHGIMEWKDGVARFCMAAPGGPRPTDFTSPPGSGRTLSAWKPMA